MESLDINEILLGLISLAGVLGTGYFGYLKVIIGREKREIQKELTQIKQEVKTDVSLSLPDINTLDTTITELFKKTKVDRFVVFKGENGGLTPLKFTSAILERHEKNMYLMMSIGATEKYIRVRFDNDYLKMLKAVEVNNDGKYLDVKEMPNNDLKGFYLDEQVKHSSIWFQKRYVINEDKHIILYYSFATHSEFKFTAKEKSLIKLAADKIAALSFNVKQV